MNGNGNGTGAELSVRDTKALYKFVVTDLLVNDDDFKVTGRKPGVPQYVAYGGKLIGAIGNSPTSGVIDRDELRYAPKNAWSMRQIDGPSIYESVRMLDCMVSQHETLVEAMKAAEVLLRQLKAALTIDSLAIPVAKRERRMMAAMKRVRIDMEGQEVAV